MCFRLAIRFTVRLTYGLEVDNVDNEVRNPFSKPFDTNTLPQLVKLSEGAGNTFSKAAQQGAWLVNSLPICKSTKSILRPYIPTPPSVSVKNVPAWFPFARFQRQALEWRPEILNSVQIPYARVKDALVSLPIPAWLYPLTPRT